jgi:two-component system heavy metal sensor histidine kinase CusS
MVQPSPPAIFATQIFLISGTISASPFWLPRCSLSSARGRARGLHPVRAIARAAGRISAGSWLAHPGAGRRRNAELVTAFNAMLGRLEDSFKRLSDFSADLAHELRTPIHSLRMQTEVSLSKARHVDEYRDLLASNLEEYERLSRIIADMLLLAKADHGLLVPQTEPLALRPLWSG